MYRSRCYRTAPVSDGGLPDDEECDMSWPATFGVALAAALAGMFAAGYTANLAVSWYRISSFEGQSGYFVVLLGIAGLVVGFVLGGIVARLVTGGALQASGAALGVVLCLTLLVGGTARVLADVPPEIGGDTLLLALEYRWPASQVEAPAAGEHEPYVRLGSVSGSVERDAATGAFWLEDSRREEGRWISPAAVEVFTERGQRAVAFIVEDNILSAVLVPLPRRPGREHLEWSQWLPAAAPSDPNGASYRFRVHRTSQPIRVERFGPFDIEVSVLGFWLADDGRGRRRIGATSAFEIRHHGESVAVEHPGMYGSTDGNRLGRATAVAVVDGPQPALLACMIRHDRPCFLLVSEAGRLRTEFVAELPPGTAGHELTSDPSRYELSRTRVWLTGRVERRLFEHGRVYQLGTALLDTGGPRTLPVNESDELSVRRWEPPVSLAPDGRSFVRIGSDRESGDALLAVTDLDGDNAYTLPIDRVRMRYTSVEDITPAWVIHHFEWVRDGNGLHRLAERRHFSPLPHRGRLSEETGGYRQYHVDGASETLLDALLEFLFEELRADRTTERNEYLTQYRVLIDGRPINVGYNDIAGHVCAESDPQSRNAHVIATIAERFDAALATGRYDHLFVR